MIVQDIDDLNNKASLFIQDVNTRFVGGFFDYLERKHVTPFQEDFDELIRNSAKPLLCMPFVKKHEVLEVLYEKSLDTFMPLFTSQQNLNTVIHTLQGVMQLHEWDHAFKNIAQELRKRLSSQDKDIASFHKKDDEVMTQRKRDIASRSSDGHSHIRNLARNTSHFFETKDTSLLNETCVSIITDAIGKEMIVQRQMADKMLARFEQSLGQNLSLNQDSASIEQTLSERVNTVRQENTQTSLRGHKP